MTCLFQFLHDGTHQVVHPEYKFTIKVGVALSEHKNRMSCTPRDFRSINISIHTLADSVGYTFKLNTSWMPSMAIPITTRLALPGVIEVNIVNPTRLSIS